MDWQPSAQLEILRSSARTLAEIRAYFSATNALEVTTPVLSRAATTDPNIHSLNTICPDVEPAMRYLHTSPEFPMKRLLAAGSGDIYQICKVFRASERGRRHNPEFTMLEWYRVGMDHQQLMQEVDRLITQLWRDQNDSLPASDYITYSDAIRSACNKPLRSLDVDTVKQLLLGVGIPLPESLGDHFDDWLDLLMSEVVFPTFSKNRFTFLYDYPVTQAALSQIGIDRCGVEVAERFEVFFGPLELANGFHELTDSEEQRRRFVQDNRFRLDQGLPELPIDENLLEALAAGIPPCSGVAVGIDRLLMVLNKRDHIDEILPFGFDCA